VYSPNNSLDFYEWIGYCDQGSCRQCANFGQEVDKSTVWLAYVTSGLALNPNIVLCPGRTCNQFVIWPTVEAKNIIIGSGINGAILFFVIVITLANMFMCLCAFRNWRARKTAAQKV